MGNWGEKRKPYFSMDLNKATIRFSLHDFLGWLEGFLVGLFEIDQLITCTSKTGMECFDQVYLTNLQKNPFWQSDSSWNSDDSASIRISWLMDVIPAYIWFRVPCCHPPPPPRVGLFRTMRHPGFVSTASTYTRRLQIVCHTRQEFTDDLHTSHMSKVVM